MRLSDGGGGALSAVTSRCIRTARACAESPDACGRAARHYAAQGVDAVGDDFSGPSAPPALGAHNLHDSPTAVLGDNFGTPWFKSFEEWLAAKAERRPAQAFHASVQRGYDVFFNRAFWIRDVTHINTVGFGNPAKLTCVSCHNLQMVGTDASAGWGDLGTTNEPWAGQPLDSPKSAANASSAATLASPVNAASP